MPTLPNPRKMLLFDGIGAMLSATLLGVVLVQFNSSFNMPVKELHLLALIACVFAVYSFSCYFFAKQNHRFYLSIIAVANLFYCCLTVWLVFTYIEELTTLGHLYFIGEMLVIVTLAIVELKISRQS